MFLRELAKQIIREMLKKKLRSFLALFGILWGTLAVILLLALGRGFYQASLNNMHGFVIGTLIFNHGETSIPFFGTPPGQNIIIHAADVLPLKKIFPQIASISPVLLNTGNITYQNQQVSTNIQGVSADYAAINNYTIVPGGRFIDRYDIGNQRNVIFIGPDLQQVLFGQNPALNQIIFVNNIPFRVIGILQTMPDAGDWYNNLAIIPYTAAINLWGNQDIGFFTVLPKPNTNSQLLQQNIISYFANQLHFSPSDTSAMSIFDFTQIYAFFTWFFYGIEIFLGFCGIMTLAVGGVGVANILFLIVAERKREIGLRMALGAQYKHILWQILFEAFILVSLGGIIGTLLSFLLITTINQFHLPTWLGHPSISFFVVVVTFLILLITALLAGYFPAKKAANMQPVDALAF